MTPRDLFICLRLIDELCEMISSGVERSSGLEEQIYLIFPKYAEELEKYLAGMKS